MTTEATSESALHSLNQLVAECTRRIERVTIPLFGFQDDQVKRDRTGVLYRVGGRSFILTASHDLHEIVQNNIPLCIGAADSVDLLIPLVDCQFHGTEEEGRDVAAIELTDEIVSQLSPKMQFLTHSDICLADSDSNALYVMFGYPEDWFSPSADSPLENEPLACVCQPYKGSRVPNAYFDPRVHILLGFSRTAVDLADQSTHQLPRLNGVSGCGIWKIGKRSKDGFERWDPDRMHLVALQHRWSERRDYIKGTWIGYALALIQERYPDVSAAMNLVYPL